jgi:hypothetical protein
LRGFSSGHFDYMYMDTIFAGRNGPGFSGRSGERDSLEATYVAEDIR